MVTKYGNRVLYTLASITFLSLASVGTHGQTYDAAIDTAAVLNSDDGPHVFWKDDSTAVVFYYCDSSIIQEQFIVRDTLTFTGRCKDTLSSYTITDRSPNTQPDHYDGVSRVLAVSDIHGDYEHFVEILQQSGVIDEANRWRWDDGHLVIVGDVFDRGPAVTECLWLIHRLEREAAAAGGAVDFLLGNHELMVLIGDLRYVNERYTEGIAYRSRFPYDELFGPDTELGRWLRTKHTVVRIDSLLFLHAGVTSDHLDTFGDFHALNEAVRSGLDYSAPERYFHDDIQSLYRGLGPLWYRGYIYGIENRYAAATPSQIDSVLQRCAARRVIVGHSEQDSVRTYQEGRVIAVDVDVETLDGQEALLWEDGAFQVVTATGRRRPLTDK